MLGRVLSRTYPDASVVSFTYTPDGRRATASDARGTTQYAYDSRRRLTQLTYPDGRVLSYGYDARGERTSVTAKLGATSLTTLTAYDAAGHIAQVTDPLGRSFVQGYDGDGELTSSQYPNGTSTSYTYDARNRLTNITTVDGVTQVQSFGDTLDEGGRRTQEVDGDGTVRAYGYDSIDRLTSETVTGALSYAKAFTYDAVGNRLTQTTTGSGAGSVTYGYDNRDRLTTEGSTTYAYDANGNLTSKAGEATYGWDLEGRLTSVTMTAGAAVAHQYDADGNRVKTSVTLGGNTASTNMLVDTAGGLSQVVAETDGSGNLTSYYVRAGDQLLSVMRPSAGTWTTRFIHGDGLGSVRALTDETGTTVDTRGYEAFGTRNTEAGSDPLTYGFAGEPFQQDSTLAYHRARWMDARVGRFLGMDPFKGIPEAPATLHRYGYVANDPANSLDATGLVSPSQLVVGKAVHDAIGADWIAGKESTSLNGRVYDQTIDSLTGGSGIDWQSNWLLKLYHGVGALARPDLAATTEHAIYEIKSIDEFGQGQVKLGWYLDLLQTLDPSNFWRLGLDSEYVPPYSIILENTVVGDYYILVDPPESGVITYVWTEYNDALKALAKGIGGVGELGPDFSPVAPVGGGFL